MTAPVSPGPGRRSRRAAPVVLAEVTRHDGTGERVESVHRGHVVVVGPHGTTSRGEPTTELFARSTAKPFQATACLEVLAEAGCDPGRGDDLTAAEVAVAWASHRGEPVHLTAVRRLLDRSGTAPDALTCPAALAEADTTWPPASPGEPPSRLRFNCSGKHAMFALAGQALGLSGRTLLDPEQPLQRRVLDVLDAGIGPLVAIGVDGCGAPAPVTRLVDLAAGYRRLVTEDRWRRVRDAGLARPLLVGGTGRLESALLAAGVVAKPGAEGVFACGWVDDRGAHGVAVKVEDGSARAAAVALHAVLAANGAITGRVWQPARVTGGPDVVGRVRPGRELLP